MKKPLISILVAAYNVQPYIKQCLDSITNQNYRNIEVIVVDDFSNDETKKICNEYKKRDSRLSIIEHSYNKGLLLTRKSAVEKANGDYTIFVDGDDFLYNENSIKEIISLINERDSDIYRFFATVDGTDTKSQKKWESFLNKGPTLRNSSIEILEDYFLKQEHPWNLWSSCYKTSLLKEVYKNLSAEGFTSCEDGYTSFLIACHSSTYYYKKTPPIYSYRIGTGISTKRQTLETYINRAKEYQCIEWIKSYLKNSKLEHKDRIYICLESFEKTLASLYVDRTLSLSKEEITSVFSSSSYLPCSRTIIFKLIEKTTQKKPIFNQLKNKLKNIFSH